MGFIHDACSNDAIGLSGLYAVMNAQRDRQAEWVEGRERERATTAIQKSFCIWETFKLPENDTTKGKLSNTQCKERQGQEKRGEERGAAGVNFTLTNNEENNAVNRNENRTVFLCSLLYMQF